MPDALYWDMADPYHYVRLHPSPDKKADYLIAGGCDHRSGEADDGDKRFADLKRWIKRLVPRLGGEITRCRDRSWTRLTIAGSLAAIRAARNLHSNR